MCVVNGWDMGRMWDSRLIRPVRVRVRVMLRSTQS